MSIEFYHNFTKSFKIFSPKSYLNNFQILGYAYTLILIKNFVSVHK